MLTTGYGFQIEFGSMDEIFRNIIESRFSDFPGLTVNASIPVSQSMLNQFIEAALQENETIEFCRVSIQDENRFSVNLKTALWPWPMNFKLRLDKAVDFTNSPTARARLENHILLGRLGSFFGALQDGIKLYGGLVAVDIESFFQTPELRGWLDLVRSVEISTVEGRVIFDLQIMVDELQM